MQRFTRVAKATKSNLRSVPKNQPGVYGIFTESGILQKVGRAKRGRMPERILESVREIQDMRRNAEKFGYITTETVEQAKRVETRLIRNRKPPFNREKKGK